MKKYIFTLLALSSTFFGSGIHANQYQYQPKQVYVIEEASNVAYVPCNIQECPFNSKSFYIGGYAGAGFLNNDGQAGFTGGLSLGYKFNHNFRIESEAAFRYQRISGVNFNTYSFMANGIIDLAQISDITPYIGFGAGYARTDAVASSHDYSVRHHGNKHGKKHGNDFVMQGIAGLSRKIGDNTTIGLEYRLFATEKNIYDHSAVLSVKRFI
jgi:opacity protein-like surface antigen